MELTQRIENDFKQALRNKQEVAVSTFRMLKAAIHNKEIEKKGASLEEGELIRILSKQIQQREDSIAQFTKGNRPDLAQKEKKELEILKKYVPEQLSELKLAQIVEQAIVESGSSDKSGFGQVMKIAMAKVKGRADGKLVSRIVSSKLSADKK